MNKILKQLDVKIFIVCMFIVAIVGINARLSIPHETELIKSNLFVEENIILQRISETYTLSHILVLLGIETISIFIILIIFFKSFKGNKKENMNQEEINNNLNQYIYKLEKTNKELVETKEELNQQKEILNRNKKEFEYKEKRYNIILDSASISIFEWNITENVVTISQWLKNLLGLENTTITSKEFLELMPEEDREKHVNVLYEYIERKKGNFCLEERYKLANGKYEWFGIVANGFFSEEGVMIKICGSIENINKQKLDSNKIHELEYTDYLTGISNKKALYKKLNKSLKEMTDGDKIFVFLIDIDDLNIVNNEAGSEVGDKILKIISSRIMGIISENSYLARTIGDEFVLLNFDMKTIDMAHQKALRILKEFEKPFFINNDKYYITASIGISVSPNDGLEADFLLKNAKEAMLKAKEIGKNTYRFFTESINRELIEKLEINNAIKKGIEKNEFYLVYQPQYNINSGRIIGFETLVRWKHKTKGIIYPIDFINVAEESGLIIPIGQKLLKKACKQIEDWTNNGFTDIIMSINLSPRQFYDKNFFNLLKHISQTNKLKKGQINFEISENILFQDINFVINKIKKIQNLGFTFSIHNVSSALISIVDLEDLPIKTIKLNKDLISNQLQTDIGKRLLTDFIEYAHLKNFEIIAEGIETEEEVEFLKQNKCSIAQGYYFSKPIDDNLADELLEKEFLI